MALQRKTKISTEFGMASMTDIIFLLLLFFMITVTVVHTNVANSIKVTLPQSTEGKQMEKTIVSIILDQEMNFSIAEGNATAEPVSFDDIEPRLQQIHTQTEMYVALYADETVPYGQIVKVLDIANRNEFKLVLATRPYK